MIVVKAKVPGLRKALKFRFEDAWMRKVGEVIVADQLDRIDKQQTPTGARLKRNRASTLARKRRQGKPLLSMVDTGRRFAKAAAYRIEVTRRGVKVSPGDKAVARHLLARGYKLIGLSKRGRAAVRAMFKIEIKRQVKAMFGRR